MWDTKQVFLRLPQSHINSKKGQPNTLPIFLYLFPNHLWGTSAQPAGCQAQFTASAEGAVQDLCRGTIKTQRLPGFGSKNLMQKGAVTLPTWRSQLTCRETRAIVVSKGVAKWAGCLKRLRKGTERIALLFPFPVLLALILFQVPVHLISTRASGTWKALRTIDL